MIVQYPHLLVIGIWAHSLVSLHTTRPETACNAWDSMANDRPRAIAVFVQWSPDGHLFDQQLECRGSAQKGWKLAPRISPAADARQAPRAASLNSNLTVGARVLAALSRRGVMAPGAEVIHPTAKEYRAEQWGTRINVTPLHTVHPGRAVVLEASREHGVTTSRDAARLPRSTVAADLRMGGGSQAMRALLCWLGFHGGNWAAPIELSDNIFYGSDGEPIRWRSKQFQRRLCPGCGRIDQREISDFRPLRKLSFK